MLIAFEGVDGSGKSSVARTFAGMKEFWYTKEPTFDSDQADRLNSLGKTEAEIEFLLDRVSHQQMIQKQPDIVCDRYLWTGLAYCRVFNNSMYPIVESLYTHRFFKKPDCYIYLDTPTSVCSSRMRVQTPDILNRLKESYDITRNIIEQDSKVITVGATGTVEDTVDAVMRKLGEHWPHLSERIIQTTLL